MAFQIDFKLIFKICSSLIVEVSILERQSFFRLICKNKIDKYTCGTVKNNKRNVLIVGDSHSHDGLNIFQSAFPEVNFLVSQRGGCPYVTNLDGVGYAFKGCAEYNKGRQESILSLIENMDYVVFSQRMSVARIEPMKEVVNFYVEKGYQDKLIVLGAGPWFKKDVVATIIKHGSVDKVNQVLNELAYSSHYRADEELGDYLKNKGSHYIYKRRYLCPDDICEIIMPDGAPISFDTHHLTLSAAEYLGRKIRSDYSTLFEGSD